MEVLSRLCSGKLPFSELPDVGARTVKLFIVSAYADFTVERAYLKQNAYPQVIEYGKRKFGLDIEIVDPREDPPEAIGVNNYQEFFINLQSRYCKCNVNCCPVILMGQKYGLPLLPRRIPSVTFQLLITTLRAHRNAVTRHYRLLQDAYCCDENGKSQPEHVLLFSLDAHSHEPVESHMELAEKNRLLSVLLKLGFTYCLQEGTISQATAQELLTFELEQCVNALLDPSTLDDNFSPVIIRRRFKDINNYLELERAVDYLDLLPGKERMEVDSQLQALWRDVDARLLKAFPYSGKPLEVLWRSPNGIDPNYHQEYLETLNDEFTRACLAIIDQRGRAKTLHKHRLYSKVFDICFNSLSRFQRIHNYSMGQEECVLTVLEHCSTENARSDPLLICGMENTGKAAVIARSYAELINLHTNNNNLVLMSRVYFETTNIAEVLDGLYQQLLLHCLFHDVDYNQSTSKNFYDFMDGIPSSIHVIIMIAGFEKLVDDYGSSIKIANYFPSALPSNVKLVLTSLAVTHSDSDVAGRFPVCRVREFSGTEYHNFIANYLGIHNRRLTSKQDQVLKHCVQEIQDIFHSSLLIWKLLTVTSFQDNQFVLEMRGTVDKAFDSILSSLEHKYGSLLMSKVSMLMSASSDGLNDNEIIDILSLDNDILRHEIGDHDHPEVNKPLQVFHFSRAKWQALKEDMRILFTTFSRDGFLVTYWTHPQLTAVVQQRYGGGGAGQSVRSTHDLINDYFQGRWHQVGKPLPLMEKNNSSPEENEAIIPADDMLVDRLCPSQEIMYGNEQETHFNVRLYRQLPRHLIAVGAHEELSRRVLFNYEWIYYKTKCLGMNELIRDYESIAPDNMAIALVYQAIEKSRPILEEDMDCLASELIGQLLPHSSSHEEIHYLLKQCDLMGPKHNGLLPTFPYPSLPGSALQGTLHCPLPMQCFYLDGDSKTLRVKMHSDCHVYGYDVLRHEMCDTKLFSHGDLLSTGSTKYAFLRDGCHLKVHDIHTGLLGGQIIPINWIEPRPFENKQDYNITQVDVCGDLLAMIVSHQVSYVFIVELATCTPVHMFRPEKLATICCISSDGQYLYTNSGQQLVGFDIAKKEQTAVIDLLAKPRKLLLSHKATRAFILTEEERRIVILHLLNGGIEMSYKIVFENSLANDNIVDISMSSDDALLLIRGRENILVYEFAEDAIIGHFKRPPEIPHSFKLPNADHRILNFTTANFLLDNTAVAASIFRDILIWSIQDGAPLALLHAPVGIITNLIYCAERKSLIGYVSTSQDIHFWNLEGTLSDGTIIDALTRPVRQISTAAQSSLALAICEQSDEMGVIDLQSGFLTDLYTHEGKVLQCCISACGNFAMVGIQPKRGTGPVNFIWCLKSRQILHEFGSSVGYYAACSVLGGHFLHVCQSNAGFCKPFSKSLLTCFENNFDLEVEAEQASKAHRGLSSGESCKISLLGDPVPYVLKAPLLSEREDYVILLAAKKYAEHTDRHSGYYVAVTHLEDVQEYALDAAFLNVTRILDVHCTHMEAAAAGILILTVPLQAEAAHTCLWVAVPGMKVMQTVSLVADFQQDLRQHPLHFTPDGSYYLDADNNLYASQTGLKLHSLAPLSMTFHGFYLHGKVALFSFETKLIAFRIPSNSFMGKVNLPSKVNCVQRCRDDRTIVVGCVSGNSLSFTLVDQQSDDVPFVVSGIQSRNIVETPHSRSWDRSIVNDENADPTTQRSDAYVSQQSSRRSGRSRLSAKKRLQELELNIDRNESPFRLADKSKSCSVM